MAMAGNGGAMSSGASSGNGGDMAASQAMGMSGMDRASRSRRDEPARRMGRPYTFFDWDWLELWRRQWQAHMQAAIGQPGVQSALMQAGVRPPGPGGSSR